MSILKRLMAYGDVEENVSLQSKTTFRIGGNCAYYVYPKSVFGLVEIIKICNEVNLPYKIFGKGSNLLCSDDFYDGIIIGLDKYLNNFYFEDEKVLVEAGCSIILLALEAANHSLSGLEFASGIPATVGGCLYMNAGAYKSSMADIVECVYVYREGKIECLKLDELAYAYRHSIFQEHRDWIILGALLQLHEGKQEEIRSLMDSRKKRRLESQPLDKPSAGSVFRNPDGLQAWKLIEDAGLRGKQIGGAQVSLKHANFIVNVDKAKASDVETLINEIQKEVKDKFNVELHAEVERFNWKK